MNDLSDGWMKRVGMDEELPLILQTIGWGKLYGGDRMT
jgi:hypothetical protein